MDPIESFLPTDDPVSQFREKGSIEGGKMSVAFEGIGEKTIGMSIGPSQSDSGYRGRSPSEIFFSKPSRPRHLLEPGDTFFNRRMGAEERKDPSPS